MELRAWAASFALKVVVAPNSLAVFSRSSISSSEALEFARTVAMVSEKLMPSWMVCLAKSTTAFLMPDRAFLPRSPRLSLSLLTPFLIAVLQADFILPRAVVSLVV